MTSLRLTDTVKIRHGDCNVIVSYKRQSKEIPCVLDERRMNSHMVRQQPSKCWQSCSTCQTHPPMTPVQILSAPQWPGILQWAVIQLGTLAHGLNTHTCRPRRHSLQRLGDATHAAGEWIILKEVIICSESSCFTCSPPPPTHSVLGHSQCTGTWLKDQRSEKIQKKISYTQTS